MIWGCLLSGQKGKALLAPAEEPCFDFVVLLDVALRVVVCVFLVLAPFLLVWASTANTMRKKDNNIRNLFIMMKFVKIIKELFVDSV
jgi:hypothetical protein